jgi:hypothetical protein
MRQTKGNAPRAIFSCGNVWLLRGAFAAAEHGPKPRQPWAEANRGGQKISPWAGFSLRESANRPMRMHAQGKISAPRFFQGKFVATECQLMLVNAVRTVTRYRVREI